MRLFIAITFSQAVLTALISLQAKLQALLTRGRLARSDNLHLTLQFLGETPAEKIPAIVAALAEVANTSAGFDLSFGEQLGYFGRSSLARVIWLGIGEGGASLQVLQSKVAAAVKALGLPDEPNAYVPHITLARDARFGRPELLQNGCVCWNTGALPKQSVSSFSLFASSLESGRRVHRCLATFKLAASGAGDAAPPPAKL